MHFPRFGLLRFRSTFQASRADSLVSTVTLMSWLVSICLPGQEAVTLSSELGSKNGFGGFLLAFNFRSRFCAAIKYFIAMWLLKPRSPPYSLNSEIQLTQAW